MSVNEAVVINGIPQHRRLLTEVPGPRSRELHARRARSISSGLGIALPVFIERSAGGILVDVDGNQLIDLASGIAVTTVGASHPRVLARITEQAQRFTHTCFMVTEYESAVAVAERLNAVTPGDFAKKTALFSTGAEAVENAVKIARSATGRPAIVVFDHGYHGRTHLTMTMTAKAVPYKATFGPYAGEVYRTAMPYPYRWPGTAEAATEQAIARLRDLVLVQLTPAHVAAIVIEPIQGEGGFIVPPAGFLKMVQDFAREHGIVFVVDEIQTGIARTGEWFASVHEGIEPDLMCIAKGLAGGMPLSAVTGRAELMDAPPVGGLGGTYAGNPVACAAALGVFEAIEAEGLIQRARDIEALAMPRLQDIALKSGIIGDVRGRGAMLAVEFVGPEGSHPREPAADLAKAVSARCHAAGVLTLVCGSYNNVVRLLPPLTMTDDLLRDALEVIGAATLAVAAG
jgi:4-aminobutyrate aminotransferase/(S)-3-amino-2-methylpropionate transaminase